MRRTILPAFILCAFLTVSNADAAHPQLPAFERFYAADDAKAVEAGMYLLGELNCVKCHAPEKQAGLTLRSAPILTGIGTRVERDHLRKYIADPQETKPGTLMPNLFTGLSDSERSQKVEALVHFLSSTGTMQQTPANAGFAANGEKLFHQVGCIACHGSQQEGAKPLATSVSLGAVDKKYSIRSLSEFLKNPHQQRPSGRMPNLNLNNEEARDIAHYFLRDIVAPANVNYQVFEGGWSEIPDFGSMKPKSTGKVAGFDLYVAGRKNNFGIRFTGFLHIEKEGDYTFHLGSDDGSRLIIDGEKIVDVDGVHPHQTRSAKHKLTAGAHEVIVDYFQGGGEWTLAVEFQGPGVSKQPMSSAVTLTPEKVEPRNEDGEQFTLDQKLVEEGRTIFASVGCANCHELKLDNQKINPTLTTTKLAELKPTGGCQSTSAVKGVPYFSLNDSQAKVLQTVLAKLDAAVEPTGEGAVFRTMATFNCYACHERNEVGGVEREREAEFIGRIPEMGDEGRIPPSLTGVGDKLNDAWLKHILNNGANDRPYMLTRMPKFGTQHVSTLLTAFPELDRKTLSARAEFDLPEYRIKSEGREMVGEKGLSCVKCHPFGNKQSTGIQALNLQTMTNRLREDWFNRYMINPQVYRRGTRMPSAWPNGRTILPMMLDGDTQKQLSAIWLYLEDGNKAAVPLGVGGQTIVLEAKERPIIYRNFIEGLSPRGIAVGYPEEAHLAFDAQEMALRMIWHGAFIDAAKHWVGRGQGNQLPLGDHLVKLPSGLPFAVLPSLDLSWPGGSARESGYEFLGYTLDSKGRPSFRYEFENLAVTDTPEPVADKDDANFLRRFTIEAKTDPPENLYFRVASGKLDKKSDTQYTFDGIVELKVSEESVLRQTGSHQELLIPVRFNGRQAKFQVEYVW